MSTNVKLLLQDKEIDLPLLKGSKGPEVIDVRSLYSKSKLFTYDPAFLSTASCRSSITFIDGEKGILEYRGHNITDLAEKHTFLEIAYLLFYGNLPNDTQYNSFKQEIWSNCTLPSHLIALIKSFPLSSHPMPIIAACISMFAALYHDEDNYKFEIIIVAKIIAIIAAVYRHLSGKNFTISCDAELSYSENFLRMIFDTAIKKEGAKALEMIFLLHADHEQNASTTAVRTTASTKANPFICLSSGVAALWGPAHGGANEAVIDMLMKINKIEDIPHFIARAKDKNDTFRLMGFGHRIYKYYDPRAVILHEKCNAVLSAMGNARNNLLDIAQRLEQIARQDEYFIQRHLYPNVDFYSGIILQAIGIPKNMFTALFALARTVGWTAQLQELQKDKEQKIYRPRQLYYTSE